jgi:hypothetical protein
MNVEKNYYGTNFSAFDMFAPLQLANESNPTKSASSLSKLPGNLVSPHLGNHYIP